MGTKALGSTKDLNTQRPDSKLDETKRSKSKDGESKRKKTVKLSNTQKLNIAMREAHAELVKKDKEFLKGEQNVVEFCPLTADIDNIGVGVKYTKKEKGGNNVK